MTADPKAAPLTPQEVRELLERMRDVTADELDDPECGEFIAWALAPENIDWYRLRATLERYAELAELVTGVSEDPYQELKDRIDRLERSFESLLRVARFRPPLPPGVPPGRPLPPGAEPRPPYGRRTQPDPRHRRGKIRKP